MENGGISKYAAILPREAHHSDHETNESTSLSCCDRFKKSWQIILGIALVVTGGLAVATGLIAGGMITASTLVGFVPGIVLGPAAGYAMVSGGSFAIGLGLALILFGLTTEARTNPASSSEQNPIDTGYGNAYFNQTDFRK